MSPGQHCHTDQHCHSGQHVLLCAMMYGSVSLNSHVVQRHNRTCPGEDLSRGLEDLSCGLEDLSRGFHMPSSRGRHRVYVNIHIHMVLSM